MDTHLQGQCAACATPLRVKRVYLEKGPMVARCPACTAPFLVRLDTRLWVFDDDPAVARLLGMTGLESADWRIERLGEAARAPVTGPIIGRDAMPAAVVFGVLHVEARDAWLKAAADAGAQRVFVTAGSDPQAAAAARAFCGIDHHVTLPTDIVLVRGVFADATSPFVPQYPSAS